MEYVHEVIINGKVRRFPSDMTISIGRGECTIKIDDSSISRRHAFIVIDSNENAYFSDGDPWGKPSRNGSFIKGTRCKESELTLLKGGEEIVLGGTCILTYRKKQVNSKDGDETLGLEDTPS